MTGSSSHASAEATRHSEAIKREASEAQRRAASPGASVWVGASAGTGKTKVLTDRVLSLLLEGTPPARILCLTFTKAAAAEMSNRLARRLAGWSTRETPALTAELESLTGRPPEAALIGTARQLFARVLDAPGGMKILTIHSFCQSLLGRFPLEAGVAPHFQVLDERSAEELLQQARETILARAGQDPQTPLGQALTEIATHAQEQSFGELIAELIQARGRLRQSLQRHGGLEGLISAIYSCLGVTEAETRTTLLERSLRDSALDLIGLRLACDVFSAGSKTDVAKGEILAAWLAGDLEDRISGFEAYASIFTTKKRDVTKRLLTKAAEKAVPSALQVLEAEAGRILELQKRLDAIAVAGKSVALLRLGAEMLERYEQLKTRRALLDYDDLIFRTRDLLQRPDIAPGCCSSWTVAWTISWWTKPRTPTRISGRSSAPWPTNSSPGKAPARSAGPSSWSATPSSRSTVSSAPIQPPSKPCAGTSPNGCARRNRPGRKSTWRSPSAPPPRC